MDYNAMKAYKIWYDEAGGKEINDLLTTLVDLNIISSDAAYDLYDQMFYEAYKHWEHPRMG